MHGWPAVLGEGVGEFEGVELHVGVAVCISLQSAADLALVHFLHYDSRASRLIRLEVAFAGPLGEAATLSTTWKMYSQFSETSVSSVARATTPSISLFAAARNILGGVL